MIGADRGPVVVVLTAKCPITPPAGDRATHGFGDWVAHCFRRAYLCAQLKWSGNDQMIVGNNVLRRGAWSKAADTITLDETARHRRRMAMVTDGGIAFLLDLAEATLLRDGDGILLDNGELIEIKAKPEPLYEIRAHDTAHLVTLAWQLGNRHLPAQVFADRILIRRDAVIRDMVVGLGASVEEIDAAFDPEGGAYHAHHHPE